MWEKSKLTDDEKKRLRAEIGRCIGCINPKKEEEFTQSGLVGFPITTPLYYKNRYEIKNYKYDHGQVEDFDRDSIFSPEHWAKINQQFYKDIPKNFKKKFYKEFNCGNVGIELTISPNGFVKRLLRDFDKFDTWMEKNDNYGFSGAKNLNLDMLKCKMHGNLQNKESEIFEELTNIREIVSYETFEDEVMEDFVNRVQRQFINHFSVSDPEMSNIFQEMDDFQFRETMWSLLTHQIDPIAERINLDPAPYYNYMKEKLLDDNYNQVRFEVNPVNSILMDDPKHLSKMQVIISDNCKNLENKPILKEKCFIFNNKINENLKLKKNISQPSDLGLML